MMGQVTQMPQPVPYFARQFSHCFPAALKSINMLILQVGRQSPRNNLSKVTHLLSHRAGAQTLVFVARKLSLLNVLVVGFEGICILDFTSEQPTTTVNLTRVATLAL